MSDNTQATIDRLTRTLGDYASGPTNVSGAVVVYDPEQYPETPWRLYDDTESREYATAAELEQAVEDYVAAWERA